MAPDQMGGREPRSTIREEEAGIGGGVRFHVPWIREALAGPTEA